MTRARLAAYGRFQLADYLVSRAILPAVMILFIAGIPRLGMSRDMNAAFWASREGAQIAHQLFLGSVALFLPLGAFFATAGVISNDRDKGHFRFLFSKPVRVTSFYAQQYLIHGAAFIAIFGAMTWGWGALTAHQSVHRAMEAAALTWVLVGGVGFALGALTRFDGAILAVVYLAATATQAMAAAAQGSTLSRWIVWLATMLPPVRDLDLTRNALYGALPLEPEQLWHVVGYGAGAWIAGWMVLRLRPLQR